VCLSFRSHTIASVTHGQQNVLTWPKFILAALVGKLCIRCLDGESATERHCIPRIYSQVHDYLLNLPPIGSHASEYSARQNSQIDIFADEPSIFPMFARTSFRFRTSG
jgi:hypothetical protein